MIDIWGLYLWVAIIGGTLIGVHVIKQEKQAGRYEGDLIGLLTILACIIGFPIALIGYLISLKD